MGPKGKKHNKGRADDGPKATPRPPTSQVVVQPAESLRIRLEVQQLILNIFREALPTPADTNLKQVIQDVKGHLFNRDFASAFGTEQYLHAYALRWSASRALAYADIIAAFDAKHLWLKGHATMPNQTHNMSRAEILCVGGGAGAEVVALAAIANVISVSRLSVTALDVADWSSILTKLTTTVTKPPRLLYASGQERDASQALLDPASLHLGFQKRDILECSAEDLKLLVVDASLVTLMFTLNELFSTSVAKTTSFLLNLTDFMRPKSWLLVVDSPGSYSEITLGTDDDARQYPMKWLLDHTLQHVAGNNANGTSKWSKHEADDSRWFRINEKLTYPLKLESMRYQIHVYQRQVGDHDPGLNRGGGLS